MRSSKTLLDKMSSGVTMMQDILHQDLSADVQVADINTCCWAMVELAHKLQQAVGDELHGLEE